MAKTNKVNATWLRNMAFEAELDGHRLVMDAAAEFGGRDLGPRPKPFMLLALVG
ncbi:MAG: OsmC family peroxiredoxin, partial [Bacteroidales bacterium]|nr:OsmC family peroxiredoxin [Bacteroidales bacterium]